DLDALDVASTFDNCPCVPENDGNDCDGDGVGDLCDTHPQEFDPAAQDTNSNGTPDQCELRPCCMGATCQNLNGVQCTAGGGLSGGLIGTACTPQTCPIRRTPSAPPWGLAAALATLLATGGLLARSRRGAA